MNVHVSYASTSALRTTRTDTDVHVATDTRRPVRFHAKAVKHLFPLRVGLRALGEAIWSQDLWQSMGSVLDPVITVHPDQILFEAFSQDASAYVSLAVDPSVFETEGNVRYGTTNIDFSTWLWGALAEIRSSRETWFRIGAEGLEVDTTGGGARFEPKVDVPDAWVRGFLEVQAAMAMPGSRFTVRPVDLLAAIRFIRFNKAKVSPRALRYEFIPEQPVVLMLEPWEEKIIFKGSEHCYEEDRSVRLWGRRRLRLLEPLLPFAETARIYLKGRARPSFYVVDLPGMKFTLGLSGASEKGWMQSGHSLGFGAKNDQLAKAEKLLAKRVTLRASELADEFATDKEHAESTLAELCRRALAIYDLEHRSFRHRQLFDEPVDLDALFPPNIRTERANALIQGGTVQVASVQNSETRKFRKLKTPAGIVAREIIYRDWIVRGAMDGQDSVEITVNDRGRIIFGKCGCDFFKDNLLNNGPCEHMLALFEASSDTRRDLPTSREGSEPPVTKPHPFEMEEHDENSVEEDVDEP